VTATFTLQQFGLTVTTAGTGTGTVTSSPAGISCGADCTQSFAFGTAVTLAETPGGGSYFGGWSGDCTGTTGTCALSMTAARTATATFIPLPNITTTTLPGGTVGTPYSTTLAETGGVAPFTWNVSAGALPAGLTLGTATGTIGGTPTADGLATFTVLVTDGNGQTDTQALSIDVAAAAVIGATQLGFLVQPTTTDRNANIAPAVQVEVRNAAGNRVTSPPVQVTMAFAANPAGGTLSGTLTRTSSNGVATFNDLRVNRAGTGYRLRATSAALTGATSDAFTIR
jgi:hypothetical protein